MASLIETCVIGLHIWYNGEYETIWNCISFLVALWSCTKRFNHHSKFGIYINAANEIRIRFQIENVHFICTV